MTEHEIQTQIINFLTDAGIYHWRNNVGRKNNMYFGLKGSGDIMGILKPSGKLLSIEVKNEKGKVSPEQTEFMDTINSCGGVAFIARSLDDVIKALNQPKSS